LGQENTGCAGLPLCVLSKNANGSRQPRPTIQSTPPPPPQVEFSPSSESLFNSVLNGDLETAKQLIEDGSDVTAEDSHGNSVLHIAAQVRLNTLIK